MAAHCPVTSLLHVAGPGVAPTCDADREDTCVAIRTAAGRRSGAVRVEPAGPFEDGAVVLECSEGGDARTGVAVPGSMRLGGISLPDRPRSIRRLRMRCSSSQRPRLFHAPGLARCPRSLIVGWPTSALAGVPRLVLS